MTGILLEGLKKSGISVENKHYFDTLTISLGEKSKGIYEKALAKGINLRNIGSNKLGITLDETTNAEDIQINISGMSEGKPVAVKTSNSLKVLEEE